MAAGLGFKDFQTGEVLTAADVDGYLMQGIWVFADSAARDAAVTSPQEGNFAFLKDTNTTTYYTGSAWTNLDTTGMVNPMTTTGDTIYSSSGSTPARLGIGTAGQVLTVNSGATAPEWATPASGGGMTLISETVLSANSALNLTSIPGTYKQLLMTWHGIYVSASGNYAQLRFNADSGTNYVFSGLNADAAGSATGNNGVNNATDANNGTFWPYDVTSSTDYGYQSKGSLIIDNYASTSKHKWYQVIDGRRYVGASKWQWFNCQGTYRSTSAITSIDITRLAGSQTYSNATNTSIRLYGIS